MWRYKWYIIAAALLSAAIAYGLSSLQDPLYEADGTVLLNDPRSSGGIANEIGLVLDPRRYVLNQSKIIESPQVAQRASENLDNGSSVTDIQEATEATPAADLDAVTVAATMPTATDAVAMVNAVVEAYEEIITEQVRIAANDSMSILEVSKAETTVRISELDGLTTENPGDSALEAQRTAAVNQLVALDTRIEFLATNVALYGSGVQLYIQPETPTTPTQPRPIRNASLALVLGSAAAMTWAWWRGEQNQIADDRDIPASILGAPLLAAIPDFRPLKVYGPIPTITAPRSQASEAYQFALSSILFALEHITGSTVLITSVAQGDGKSATAINLSIVAAQSGQGLLLIDADERAQGLTRLAGLQDELGVSDFNGPDSLLASIHRWSMEDGTTLDFVPAGRGVIGNTAGFFRTDLFRTDLETLLNGREIAIIDSPPVMAAAETTDLASAADAIVLVVREGTPKRYIEDALRRLSMSSTPIIGYVFNRASSRSDQPAYGHGYGTTQ